MAACNGPISSRSDEKLVLLDTVDKEWKVDSSRTNLVRKAGGLQPTHHGGSQPDHDAILQMSQ